jgi:hypothetical protein
MEATAPELSVREVLRAPTTTEFAGVEAFARRVTHRFRPMADTGRGYGDRLSAGIEARWSLPRHLDGLDILDAQGFENMVHDWQSRRGYDDLAGEDRGPFVIPVDPVEDVGGYTAADAQIGRGRERLRAVVPQARPTPRQSSPARERWRNAGQGTFSPYPAALGNAGRIEGSLLRFPEARAVATAGTTRALVVDDSRGGAWGHVAPFAAAARSAERAAGEIIARSQPAPTTPVGLWLERAESPRPGTATQAPTPRPIPLFSEQPAQATRAPGRWQGNTFAGIVHAPETPSQAPGRLAQQFLDAPPADGPMLSNRAFEALPGYETDAFSSERDFIAPTFAPVTPSSEPSPTVGTGRARPRPTAITAALPGTPAALPLRSPVSAAQAPAMTRPPQWLPAATTSARLATSPLVVASPRTAAAATETRAAARPSTFQVTSALQAPLTTAHSDATFPSLTRAAFLPSATRAAAAAESAPLARRLAAEADETPALAQARFEVAPRAPELWSGLEISDTTLVQPTGNTAPVTTTEGEPRSVALPARARRAPAPTPTSTRPSARALLPVAEAPIRPGARPVAAPRPVSTAPAPMSRASIAQVVLPGLFEGRMGAVAHALMVPVGAPRISPAAQAAERAVESIRSPVTAAARAEQSVTQGPRRARPSIRAQILPDRDAPSEPGGRPTRGLRSPLATYSETFVDSGPSRTIQRFTLDAGLPLASVPVGHVAQGVVAAEIADLIAARFPTEEDGPWGPRVVLPGRDLAIVEDAPTAELVQPAADRGDTPQAGQVDEVRPRRASAPVTAPANVTAPPTSPRPPHPRPPPRASDPRERPRS